MLRPSTHPSFWSPSRNAATKACPSRSLSANPVSTPIRRTTSGCCARAASGHDTAAPPSRLRASCVSWGLPRVLRSAEATYGRVGDQDVRLELRGALEPVDYPMCSSVFQPSVTLFLQAEQGIFRPASHGDNRCRSDHLLPEHVSFGSDEVKVLLTVFDAALRELIGKEDHADCQSTHPERAGYLRNKTPDLTLTDVKALQDPRDWRSADHYRIYFA